MAERLSDAELAEIEARASTWMETGSTQVSASDTGNAPAWRHHHASWASTHEDVLGLLAELRALKADLARAEKRAEQTAAQNYCTICGRVLNGDEVNSRHPVRPYIIDPLAHP